MKSLKLILLLLPISTVSLAQKYHHYFTVNTTPYVNYFNKEKESFPNTKFNVHPGLSYKIEKDKLGLELFFNANLKVYNYFNYDEIPTPDSTYLNIEKYKFGIALHYNIFRFKWLTIDAYIGLVQDKYEIQGLLGWDSYLDHTWYDAKLFNIRKLHYGIVSGISTRVYIYERINVNVNIKYSLFPTSYFNRMNLFGEVGLGYTL